MLYEANECNGVKTGENYENTLLIMVKLNVKKKKLENNNLFSIIHILLSSISCRLTN